MTIDEAIKNREDCLKYLEEIGPKASPDCLEAVRWSAKALKALRPVSREQVEQIKGVWIFNDDWWEFRCSECHKGIGNIEKYKFCPHCGAPMTDKAVQMVMERLEALKDGL